MGIFIILSSLALFVTVSSSALLGTLSAEAGLLFALVVGPLSFISGTKKGAQRSNQGFAYDFVHEGLYILVAFLLFIIAAFFNSFRLDSCAEDRGLFPIVVLALPVLWINLVSGIWLGRLIGKINVALLASFALIGLYIAFQIAWWWQAPSLRFFNHYLIVIAGDFMAGQGLNSAIIAYRISTLLYGIAFFIFGILAFKSSNRQLQIHSHRPAGLLWTAIVVIAFAFWIQIKSGGEIAPSLSQLEAHYSLVKKRGFLILHANPMSVTSNDADAILAEGTFWLERLKRRTGVTITQNIHIWLHDDIKTQAFYTGAKNIHFALPAHREIHISGVEIPHPTLGHKLAHLFIAEKSTTLFGVAGVLGVFPNYGLNEGLAVFLTPELAVTDDLTVMEQASSIYRLGYLKDFASLFSIKPWDFWFESNTTAYIASASFLEYLFKIKTKNQREGQLLFQQLVTAGELFPVWKSEEDYENFLRDFNHYLLSSPLPPDALDSVRQLFKKNSIFYAQCPTEVVQSQSAIQAAAMQKNYSKCQKLIQKNSTNTIEYAQKVASIAAQNGDNQKALLFLEKAYVAAKKSNAWQQNQILEERGDILWEIQHLKGALQSYQAINMISLSIPRQRQLMIKIAFVQSLIENKQILPLAQAVSQLLSFFQTNDWTKSALFASIGLLIGKNNALYTISVHAWLYSYYLLARQQMRGENYDDGLSILHDLITNAQFPNIFYFESQRLIAHAYGIKQDPLSAYYIYQELKTKNNRAAEQLLLQDLSERALKAYNAIGKNLPPPFDGDRWLLGIPQRFRN